MQLRLITLAYAWFLLASFNTVSAAEAKLMFNGDLRAGYFSLDREDRNGADSKTNEWRVRVRPGAELSLTDTLKGKMRIAGRYSTDDRNNNHFELFSKIPAGDGLRRGDSTIDELFLNYQPSKQLEIRAGRMQTKFELDGVAKKSLDRSNSGNTDITWTDGVHVKHKGENGWNTHVIVQYNPPGGSTEVRRSPLNFDESGSRTSYFLAFENKQPMGPIVQRGIDINYLPDSLRTDGTANGRIDDYWGLVGRVAAKWPIGNNGMKFMLAGELGYAPNTPTRVATSTGTSGDNSGVAGQLTFNFLNIVPRHNFGLVLGTADAGWLLSPDFSANTRLIEGRYQWKIDKKNRLEARLRRRDDMDSVTASTRKRKDVDFYVRYTYKF